MKTLNSKFLLRPAEDPSFVNGIWRVALQNPDDLTPKVFEVVGCPDTYNVTRLNSEDEDETATYDNWLSVGDRVYCSYEVAHQFKVGKEVRREHHLYDDVYYAHPEMIYFRTDDMKPFADHILVKSSQRTETDIILLEKNLPSVGIVQKTNPYGPDVGQKILYRCIANIEVEFEGEKYFLMRNCDVFAHLDPDEEVEIITCAAK